MNPSGHDGPNIAPSTPIAQAARAFGDDYPPVRDQLPVRVAGVLLIVASLWYLPWMLRSLNGWGAAPFAVVNIFTLATGLLSVANSWRRSVPAVRLHTGTEPLVGVIIPTCGEPVPMILRTVQSVFEQDWPQERLAVVVSDDAADPQLRDALEDWPVVYHRPPPRTAPERNGAAKAGNLNSALELLRDRYPAMRFVETRDADDELPSLRFLRQCVGQLEADRQLAYVQTIKEAQVAAGDPFNNRESIFYRSQMIARNASNAVFPCGSGVVWRETALADIGDFPTWNLVEDLQSGVEALRRGWNGMYLPIVGAVPQHSPHDVPNFYKQRGTWALDTTRLMVWGNLRGLSVRQRLQFYELLFFYLASFAVPVYVGYLAAALLGFPPLVAGGLWSYALHMTPPVLATEAWLYFLNEPYNDRRGRQRQPYRELWKVRTMWAGLAPVFMKAVAQALAGGPNRKPVYRVTLKNDDMRWHWRYTLPQTMVLVSLGVVGISAARYHTYPNLALLTGGVYWGALNIVLLANFVSRSWHGLKLTTVLAGLRRPQRSASEHSS